MGRNSILLGKLFTILIFFSSLATRTLGLSGIVALGILDIFAGPGYAIGIFFFSGRLFILFILLF